VRVVVVAEESAGVQVLHRLLPLRPATEIVAVLTSVEAAEHRRRVVHEAALQLGLETWPAELVRSPDLAARLREAAVDILLNVHSLFLIHPDVAGAPRIGSFNLHPGPLPEYAGLNVPSWAVYRGEPMHGVTLHWMDAGIDSGPIAWQERFELTDEDTGLSVSGKCVRLGVPLVLRLIEAARKGISSIPRTEQDRTRRRYFGAGPPEDGVLDWSRPAVEILRFVRAADYAPFPSPWGHPEAAIEGRRVGIARATSTATAATTSPGTVEDVCADGALVATGDDLIAVKRVCLDGKYLKAADLLAD
jgi:methionyl-tRNA formyltransferase